MGNIRDLLNNIKYAIFGKDVRGSIHDAIEECYRSASVDHDNANMEVKIARGVFETLDDRLTTNDSKIYDLNKNKAEKSYVDKITQSIASGSPKDIFQTVAALQSNSGANTTEGKKSIYLVLEDANWYYWNGAAWAKGGVYQSMGISDNSIKPIMLENGIELLNLYQYPETCVEGRYITNLGNWANGSGTAHAKVPVKPLTKYSFWRENGNYQVGKGWTVFMNADGETIQMFDASLYISGTYNGVEYVTVETPNECAYLCFNVRLGDFDNRTEAIVVEGEEMEVSLGIKKVFDYHLIDTLLRNKFDVFLNSFKSTGNNLYSFEKHYLNNKYVNLEGDIDSAGGWGLARIPVKEDTTYSIYMPEGNYANDIGALSFYNDNGKVSFHLPAKDFVSGQYNGVDYLTFKTPIACSFVCITCKRGADIRPFDNSKSLLCFEGNIIDDTLVKNYLTEINGYSIKICNESSNQEYSHPLKDKKWVVVGDSLTERNSRALKFYHDYIAEITGVNVFNMGSSGTGYKRSEEGGGAFYQRINSIPTDADIVTIFGSGNDLGLLSSSMEVLGEVTDTTTDTICGCINVTLDNLYKRIPTVRLGIVTPTPWVGYPPHVENNKMELYTQKLIEICRRRSIPVLDLYHGCNLRPWDATFRQLMYSRDDGNGVHPDENGHKQIHRFFLNFIETL